MDVATVFHMTGGNGLTSYTNNSSLQRKASDTVKHRTLEAAKEVYRNTTPNSFAVADLGCSSGPNTVSIIRDIIGSVHEASREIMSSPPELIQVFLNDLPSNDFNSIFKTLPDFSTEFGDLKVLVGAYPGTFYRRLFPNNYLHFVYASHSVHWLSKVPSGIYDEQGKSINKEAIYISKMSPKAVEEAYYKQFKEDFSSFLRLRSEEMTDEGKMVLILLGREGQDHVDRGNMFFWEVLWRSLAQLASEGMVSQEKLESYEVHFYAPTKEELIEEVEKSNSFKLEQFESFGMRSDENGSETMSYGTMVAKTVRAIQESMISDHFGADILDALFDNYGKIMDKECAMEVVNPITFQLVLRKL